MRVRVDENKAIVRFNSTKERETFIDIIRNAKSKFDNLRLIRNFGGVKIDLLRRKGK